MGSGTAALEPPTSRFRPATHRLKLAAHYPSDNFAAAFGIRHIGPLNLARRISTISLRAATGRARAITRDHATPIKESFVDVDPTGGFCWLSRVMSKAGGHF